jgi:hypothetical protein
MTSATSAANSVVLSTSSTTTMAPPAPKRGDYSIVELVLAFFKEKVKEIAKTGSYLLFWAMQAIPNLPPGVTKFNNTLRNFKNFISVTEIPEKLRTWSASVSVLAIDLSTQLNGTATATWEKVGIAARKVFKDSMSLISLSDTFEFLSLFIPISKEALRCVMGINFAATIGFAGNSLVEHIQNLNSMDKADSKRGTFYLINFARDISYFALGVIGLTFILTGTAIVAWMIFACLTSGLIFSIGSYFYEKIVDPENKGKNLNPAIILQNDVNQRMAQITAATA